MSASQGVTHTRGTRRRVSPVSRVPDEQETPSLPNSPDDAQCARAPWPGRPRVVGLDVSLTSTGIASSLGWVERVGSKQITTLPLVERVRVIDTLARDILTLVGTPTLVCIEIPAFSRSGGGTLERSALWWLVVRSLIHRDVPLAGIYAKSRALYATGLGNAGKSAIVDAVARRLPMFETGGNDDLADAAILAAMGADWLGHPLASFPKANRQALGAVLWPPIPKEARSDEDRS